MSAQGNFPGPSRLEGGERSSGGFSRCWSRGASGLGVGAKESGWGSLLGSSAGLCPCGGPATARAALGGSCPGQGGVITDMNFKHSADVGPPSTHTTSKPTGPPTSHNLGAHGTGREVPQKGFPRAQTGTLVLGPEIDKKRDGVPGDEGTTLGARRIHECRPHTSLTHPDRKNRSRGHPAGDPTPRMVLFIPSPLPHVPKGSR